MEQALNNNVPQFKISHHNLLVWVCVSVYRIGSLHNSIDTINDVNRF